MSFEAGGDYNQHDAGAFIKLNALRMRVQARVKAKADVQAEQQPAKV